MEWHHQKNKERTETVTRRCSIKNVFRNFAKFTGKQLCQSPFYNKVAGLACNFMKKEILAQAFSCKFCEISKNTFYQRTPLVAASLKKERKFLKLVFKLN